MSTQFKAFVLSKDRKNNQIGNIKNLLLDDLMEGDVTIKIKYSSFNYKDGLAIAGKKPIIKTWPMIPGVDFCGKVIKSESPNFQINDKVILNGWVNTSRLHGKIVLIEENTVTLDIYRGTKVKFDKNSISFEMSSAK